MRIFLTKEAQKQYKKLQKIHQDRIKTKLLSLERDPFTGKKLKGEFSENRCIRAWPYRIFYIISESKKEIWITSIIHRQGAYN